MNIQIDKSLVEYMVGYLQSDYVKRTLLEMTPALASSLQAATFELQQILAQSEYIPGQRIKQSDPNRNDVGLGPVLNNNSDYL